MGAGLVMAPASYWTDRFNLFADRHLCFEKATSFPLNFCWNLYTVRERDMQIHVYTHCDQNERRYLFVHRSHSV
jgi:hypothetical protein